jgi:hypothetical protein
MDCILVEEDERIREGTISRLFALQICECHSYLLHRGQTIANYLQSRAWDGLAGDQDISNNKEYLNLWASATLEVILDFCSNEVGLDPD